MKRRYLVMTDEGRGHPFRRSLPLQRMVEVKTDDSDLKLFVLSFTAFFVCFYTFLI
jgi:NADH:ubiquinone oxidoreductase subunit C